MGEKIRIQKLLAGWGLAARRKIEEWILHNRIKVNGKLLSGQGVKVDPEVDAIEVDGKRVFAPAIDFDTRAFHKPKGVLTTMDDGFGRNTVRDFLPKEPRLFPVGRLDFDSTGLILVTNHGDLAFRLLHPKFKVEKEYVVSLGEKRLVDKELKLFSEGLEVDGRTTLPCKIELLECGDYRITLSEGRKRQIRQMFLELGFRVLGLHRTRFGPITLGTLKPGELRSLTPQETKKLLIMTDMT